MRTIFASHSIQNPSEVDQALTGASFATSRSLSGSPLSFTATPEQMALIEAESLRTLDALKEGMHPHLRVATSTDEALELLRSPSIGGVILDSSIDFSALSKLTELSLRPTLSEASLPFIRDRASAASSIGDRIIKMLGESTSPRFTEDEVLAVADHYAELVNLASNLGSVYDFPIVFRESSVDTILDEFAAEKEIHVDDEPIILEAYGFSRTKLYLPDAVRCTGIQSYELVDPSGVLTLPQGRPLIMKGVPIPDELDFSDDGAIVEHYESQVGIRHSRAEDHHAKSLVRLSIYSGQSHMYLMGR